MESLKNCVLTTKDLKGNKRYWCVDQRFKGLDKQTMFSRGILKLMTETECQQIVVSLGVLYRDKDKEKTHRLNYLKIERVVFEEIG